MQILNSLHNYVSVFLSILNVYILKASLIDSFYWLCFLLSQLFLYLFSFMHFFRWCFIYLFHCWCGGKGCSLFINSLNYQQALKLSAKQGRDKFIFSSTTFNLEHRPLCNVTLDSCLIFAEGYFYACLSIGLKQDQDQEEPSCFCKGLSSFALFSPRLSSNPGFHEYWGITWLSSLYVC